MGRPLFIRDGGLHRTDPRRRPSPPYSEQQATIARVFFLSSERPMSRLACLTVIYIAVVVIVVDNAVAALTDLQAQWSLPASRRSLLHSLLLCMPSMRSAQPSSLERTPSGTWTYIKDPPWTSPRMYTSGVEAERRHSPNSSVHPRFVFVAVAVLAARCISHARLKYTCSMEVQGIRSWRTPVGTEAAAEHHEQRNYLILFPHLALITNEADAREFPYFRFLSNFRDSLL